MNVFEEHQRFIPIINDSRFAISLREVKRKSTKVAAKIAELDSTADKIRDALDARA